MYRFWFLFSFVGQNNVDVFILYISNTLDIDILDVLECGADRNFQSIRPNVPLTSSRLTAHMSLYLSMYDDEKYYIDGLCCYMARPDR
jgi:hypothetical protein